MAKFCTGYEDFFYIDDNLRTYASIGPLSRDGIEDGAAEEGVIVKRDKGLYYEYTGELAFIAPKDIDSTLDYNEHSIEISRTHYVVEGTSRHGNNILYVIDFEGSLLRFDEIVESKDGRETTVVWNLCGGKFIVN